MQRPVHLLHPGLKVATNARVHPDIAGAARSDDD